MAELIGAQRRYQPLILKRHNPRSLNAYLGQLDLEQSSSAVIHVGYQNKIRNLCLQKPGTEAELAKRFPLVSSLFGTFMVSAGPISRSNAFNISNANYSSIENCLAVNKKDSAVRIRHISFLLMMKSSESGIDYENHLARLLRMPACPDLRIVPIGDSRHILAASSFASLYLMDRLRETTLGEYLRRHEDILLTALGARRIIYEPFLEWQEGNPDPDEMAINPDLLIERADGNCDICELKLPLLDRKVTRAERRRRRFTDKAMEGISQLAHYEEYFKFPRNRDFAYAKYGARFEQPRKVLVIGNYENVDLTHIAEASRMINQCDIIDYDTLLQLYLAGKRAPRVPGVPIR